MAVRKSPQGIQLRVRRSVDDLSSLDLGRLRRAFQTAMEVPDDRGYQHWAGIHGLPQQLSQHRTPAFLPWHRAYLVRFETALRSFEPSVTLPWWDWSSSRSHKNGIPKSYNTPTVDGRPNTLYAVEIDPKLRGQNDDIPAQTSRESATPTQLPGKESIEELLEINDFATFASTLENLHNRIHGWVGGTNGLVSLSSYDPFFWAYQASIDRIWWLWQQTHVEEEPPKPIADQPLPPFAMSVADAWDTTLLGYDYAEPATRSEGFLAGATCDLPAAADQLNFADYAQAFAEIIASPDTTAPLTIGIYGSWGIGKSSLLKMIGDEFPDQQENGPAAVDVRVVRFNAWEYNSSDKIWPSLVRRIMERMEEASQWSFWDRFANTLKRNLGRYWRLHRNQLVTAIAVVVPLAVLAAWTLHFSASLILAAIAVVGLPGLIKLGIDATTNPVSRWVGTMVEQGRYGDELPYMREIHGDLSFLTEQMQSKRRTAKEQDRVLVMIDDLDRCEPAKAVEVLQAINLLLDFSVFVVCLGIDARVITAAVEAHYEQLLGRAGATGYEYLDKIVQIPFRIPTASSLEIERFLESQMPVSVSDPAEREFSSTTGDSSIDATTSYDPQPSGQDVKVEASQAEQAPVEFTKFDQAEVEAFQRLAPFIRRNPRHIKRLVNVYRMVRTLAARRGVKEILENPQLTISWIVICAQWPYTVSAMLEAFEEIVEQAGNNGYPDTEPLPTLYRRVEAGLLAALQSQIDDDVEDLVGLLDETPMSWLQLGTVQPYTLNFNPAIEEALHRGHIAGSPG
jgi:tyrosinase